MQNDEIQVLLIEDDTADDELIAALLLRSKTMSFRMERATRLGQALDRLAKDRVDLVLLDLSLPDSWGLDTFVRAHSLFPDVPIIVLTGLDDEETAFAAVQKGAQDYLVKGALNSVLLQKTVRYAIERQKLVAQLKGKIEDIGKLERERKNMLSMFAHDIKNALIPSIGFLERILSGKTIDMQDKLKRTRDELLDVEQLVNNFMDFARIDRKEYSPQPVPCDLGGILRGQIDNALIKAERKGITIRYETGSGISSLEADCSMVKRVIMNLLDNAVKYTDPGGSVIVRALSLDNKLRVEVEDTGIGIPGDKLPFVFDAFYRATRDQKGSGLGLAICKIIVEAHAGTMWVDSTPGKGSIFGFSLPKVALRRQKVLPAA
jgi:signal transduction histidine kinase